MKLSFFPGGLHLFQEKTGEYVVQINGTDVLRTASQKSALTKFHGLRREMEAKYPTRELTPEEKAEVLKQAIGNSLVGHNSLGGRKKKTTAGGTRTFGG